MIEQSVYFILDVVKRLSVFLLSVVIASASIFSSGKAPYDFTLYKTADNSVMGVKGDKLGLDITGYGFLGSSNKRGVYFRIGLQTPFDTILGYLNSIPDRLSSPAKDDNKGEESGDAAGKDPAESMDSSHNSDMAANGIDALPSVENSISGESSPGSFDSLIGKDEALPEISNDILESNNSINNKVDVIIPDLTSPLPGANTSGENVSDKTIPVSIPSLPDTSGENITVPGIDSAFPDTSSENIAVPGIDSTLPDTSSENITVPGIDYALPDTSSENITAPGVASPLPDTSADVPQNKDELPPIKQDTGVSNEGESEGDGKSPIGSSEEIEPAGDEKVVKAKAKNDSFNKEWRLLLTIGPAYRSFMGEDAMAYLGYGVSIDMGHRQELEKDTKYTITSTYMILGADADMGLRYTVRGRTSIRVGVHFTVSLIGVKYQSVFSSSSKELSHDMNIYGYSLGKKGIFETLNAKGYIMLATAFNGKKATAAYNYSNTTVKLGGGTITEASGV